MTSTPHGGDRTSLLIDSRLLSARLAMAEDPREHQRQRAARVAARTAGILGTVAALVSCYDLLQLMRVAGH